jgi:hypothetical protein
MAETINKAALAGVISNQIFGLFGWASRPLHDHNWDCVTKKHDKKTHPADVVFTYEDPFQRTRPYILTDLKCYSKTTINWTNVKEALESLAMSVDCAHRSASFRELYIEENDNFSVTGMLFIYNHDNLYLKGVDDMLKDTTSKMIGLRAGLRLAVVGPERIIYLKTIANDIHVLRGKNTISGSEDCEWFYPDLKLSHPKSETSVSATLETLLGPWQILKFRKAGSDKQGEGFVFYYDGPGDTPEEFAYVLDCLFQFQLVKKNFAISIRMPNASAAAKNNFEKAKETFSYEFFPVHDLILDRLKQITFERIDKIQANLSEIDTGMRGSNE